MSRTDMLAALAGDASLERADFLARAGRQLQDFVDSNRERISDLGGLTLIDEDPDYLSIAPMVGVWLDSGLRRPSRRSDATRRSRKMIVWPATRSNPMTAKSKTAESQLGQPQATDSGVRTTKKTRTATWNQKQPSPGPRSGSSRSP